MLTLLLIGGLVWLGLALVFVLALAAAARAQVSPVTVTEPRAVEAHQTESSADAISDDDGLLPAEAPIPT